MRVLIIGAGGHGQVVADILMAASRHGGDDYPCGYLDQNEGLWTSAVLDIRVLGSVEECARFEHDAVIVGVGDNLARRRLFERLSRSLERFAIARHPGAIVSPNSSVSHGTVICAGAIVNTGASIGANVILNTGCSVDHHNVIGDHAHIAPGARLGGDVKIGDGALVGIGAIVLPGRRVGAWSVIGAGAVVTEDIPEGVVAIGTPARALVPRTAALSGSH